MAYLVRLSERALRDLEAIYEFIQADSSQAAFGWFNELSAAVFGLERFPERGAVVRENKKLRQLIFGAKPNCYRIIYKADKRRRSVTVLHIRHGARDALHPE